MKYCENCGKELPEGGDICLSCGKMIKKNKVPEKKKKKRTWIIIVIIVLVIIIAAAGSGSDNAAEEKESNNSSSQKNTEKFTYEISDQYSNSFTYYIEGYVKNNRDKDYSYVQIEFVCYDADGNNLGTAIDNTNNLLANQTWKFKAMFLGTDKTVDHCDYHEITSW